MWFKVVLNKDGSVASCDQVAESFDNGRCVLYIEANSKAEALTSARLRRNAKKLEVDHKLKTLGLCVSCRRPAAEGKVRCESCQAKIRANDRARQAGTYQPPTAEERSAARANRTHTNNERLIAFYECRAAYNRDPRRFAEWLQKQIDACFAHEKVG